VLPVVGGRYSHGVVVPFRGTCRLAPTRRLSSLALLTSLQAESCGTPEF
jgi:hypothetical protein